MAGEDTKVLFDFIQAGDAAFAAGGQDRFWPMNHHRITPLIPKAGKLLTKRDHRSLLFHAMRRGMMPKSRNPEDLAALIDVYRRLVPLLDQAQVNSLDRLPALFRFGFDDTGALPGSDERSAADDTRHARFLDYAWSYTNIPGQTKKIGKFAAFTDLAPRMLVTLRHLRYNHDRRYSGDPDYYNYNSLLFWAMAHVLLLDPRTASPFLADMMDDALKLPLKETQLDILDDITRAACREAPRDDAAFARLAEKLHAGVLSRRKATETWQLNGSLCLGFDIEDDWSISAVIPIMGGVFFRGPRATLDLLPFPKQDWRVRLSDIQDRSYSEAHSGILQNDPGLAPLGAGNLHMFPAWLRQTAARLGMDLDYENARIFTGRNRKAAKAVAAWLKA
jgi:hypothetical protein